MPGLWALANVYFEIFDIHIISEHIFINKKLPFRVVILTGIQINKRNMFFCYFPVVFIKQTMNTCTCGRSILGKNNLKKEKRTRLSARSPSTGNLRIASPKSWWCRRYCRWQFAFHRDSTPLNWPWNCEKSVHESTEKNAHVRVAGQFWGKIIWKKKNVPV